MAGTMGLVPVFTPTAARREEVERRRSPARDEGAGEERGDARRLPRAPPAPPRRRRPWARHAPPQAGGRARPPGPRATPAAQAAPPTPFAPPPFPRASVFCHLRRSSPNERANRAGVGETFPI